VLHTPVVMGHSHGQPKLGPGREEPAECQRRPRAHASALVRLLAHRAWRHAQTPGGLRDSKTQIFQLQRGSLRQVKAPPRAGSLIESMRDIGYSIETAVADIIDNSITAEATRVDIRTRFDGVASRIEIIDNGNAMTEAELIEAMRPGTKSPTDTRADGDLGRFGLGLKTASFSQCRRLTVVSRKNGKTCAAIWDLDHVVATDEWTLSIPEDPAALDSASLLSGHGTVVVWEKLDRLAGEDGNLHESDFDRAIASVADYLALVFHRFLLGRSRRKSLQIYLNDSNVEPFDPFFSARSYTDPPEVYRYGGKVMKVRTYTLPHFSSVSKQEWERYGGADGYLKNQGFYVFRGDRLIVYGTWFGLMRQGELTKLTRVSLDLPTSLDGRWKVDVKKASAQPPPEVRRYLRGLVERMSLTGRRVFTNKGTRATSKEHLPVWQRVVEGEHVSYRVDTEHPAIAHLLERCPAGIRPEVETVLELVAGALPLAALYNDIASSPETTVPAAVSTDALTSSAISMTRQLYAEMRDPQKVLSMMKVAEPFASHWGDLKGSIMSALELAEEE
jgi:hypothetical protein